MNPRPTREERNGGCFGARRVGPASEKKLPQENAPSGKKKNARITAWGGGGGQCGCSGAAEPVRQSHRRGVMAAAKSVEAERMSRTWLRRPHRPFTLDDLFFNPIFLVRPNPSPPPAPRPPLPPSSSAGSPPPVAEMEREMQKMEMTWRSSA
ncbi:hypothetical protein BRADI_1g57152v3 [Brachypodium distachyon]|uniref:Uncharacterized protein n=1 Tax=Brachypodium distachyon TaxID=15368 RepID=A0A2K2DS02_BRADI|nr:hypothetical protein BRADI_1g57152v3 [Brachypodium distachyon]